VKLLDTMLVVYARDPKSEFNKWAVHQIADAVRADGAGMNAVSLAELCAGDGVDESAVAAAIESFGIQLLDVPFAAAERCGAAYRIYRHKRKTESDKDSPRMPLPDFFIGAHAEVAGLELVTNDAPRFKNYFPAVKLITPSK
jgi:predicted nucleic acid-binding protein